MTDNRWRLAVFSGVAPNRENRPKNGGSSGLPLPLIPPFLRPTNQEVAGSSPAGPATNFGFLRQTQVRSSVPTRHAGSETVIFRVAGSVARPFAWHIAWQNRAGRRMI